MAGIRGGAARVGDPPRDHRVRIEDGAHHAHQRGAVPAVMGRGPAHQDEPDPRLCAVRGPHGVQDALRHEHVVPNRWTVVLGDEAEVKPRQREARLHEHDRPAPTGHACGEHRQVGRVPRADEERGVR